MALQTQSRDLTLFNQSNRLQKVEKLSDQYRFFHNELEFIEVFKERGGFDVIVGNPPWLKLEFESKVVIAEKKPEVVVKDMDAAGVDMILEETFEDDPS